MKHEELKEQLQSNLDDIITIISKGNTAEIKKNTNGVLILEVSKKKLIKDKNINK